MAEVGPTTPHPPEATHLRYRVLRRPAGKHGGARCVPAVMTTTAPDRYGTSDTYTEFRRGELYLEMGEPIEAARILVPVAEQEPENRAVLELLARAYFASAQLHRAEQTLRDLLQVAPTDAWAHRALARSLERQSRHDDAATQHRVADALGAA